MEKSLKQLSIFILFIFLISIFGISFHHHESGTSYDHCIICNSVAENKYFLTQDTRQTFSNSIIIATVFLDQYSLAPYALTRTFSIRAPPENSKK